jgi:transcriptional regulator GlxA family with amidase domain
MQIAFGLFPGFTALDAVGPFQVLTQIPGAEVVFAAEQAGIVADDSGVLRLEVDRTFADVPTPDVLVIPGGLGTRRLVRDGSPIVEWIAAAHPHTTWTTSVCTGALLLAKAGLLDGLRATTHWFAYDQLQALGAMPTEQRVVFEGKVVTAAGVSSGIDLALALAAKMEGDDLAKGIQLGIEYDPQPPFDAGAPSKADPELVELIRAVMGDAEQRVLAEIG